MAGDTTRARTLLDELAIRDSIEVQDLGVGPQLVEAAIATMAGRWDTVPPLLGRAVRWVWPYVGISASTVNAGNLVRWLVAEAYEHLGRADSAAAVYELLASPQSILQAQNDWRVSMGMVGYSFAHFHLGGLYTQLKQYDQAQEHYLTFLDTFTRPDPEYAWMVTEAQAKLEELARGR